MVEIRAKINGEKSGAGYLVFDEGGVKFHEDFRLGSNSPIDILAQDVFQVSISSAVLQDNPKTFGRAFFFGWRWAMLFPKFQAGSMVEIELSSGELYFFETDEEELKLRQKINPIITRWFAE